MLERLQKILSSRGICSRRKAEEYIEQGLVRVNGVIATLGQKADAARDTIEVNGSVLDDRKTMLYYVMNKPVGIETTNVARPPSGFTEAMPRARRKNASHAQKLNPTASSVRDLLPAHLQGRIYPVGRLDKDSSGLLLFTNDGVLAYRLTHPRFHHEKEYEVVLDRPVRPIELRALQDGFVLDGSKTKPLKAWKVAPQTIRIVLTEGRNRQIRRMCQHIGYTVKSLSRVRIMTLADDRLPPSAIRALSESEKAALLASVQCGELGKDEVSVRRMNTR